VRGLCSPPLRGGITAEVRRTEVATLRRDGYEPILTQARWYLLKRPENLTDYQDESDSRGTGAAIACGDATGFSITMDSGSPAGGA